MHCSKCGRIIPKAGDNTICPNCRTSVKRPNRQHEFGGEKDIKKVKTASLTHYSYIAIIGIALLLFGIGIIFFYPFPSPSDALPSPPYEDLLDLAIVSTFLGIALLTVYAAHRFSRPMSKDRLGDRASLTLFGAMRSGIALPTWWKWWYSGIPVVVLTVIQAEAHFSALVYWSLFLGYTVVWMAYVFFISKRWLQGKG